MTQMTSSSIKTTRTAIAACSDVKRPKCNESFGAIVRAAGESSFGNLRFAFGCGGSVKVRSRLYSSIP